MKNKNSILTMKPPLDTYVFICSSQLTPQYVGMQLEKPFIPPVAWKHTQETVLDNAKGLRFPDQMEWVL